MSTGDVGLSKQDTFGICSRCFFGSSSALD